jgi:hypothetical protein
VYINGKVSMYVNGKIRPIESVLRMGGIRENDGGSEFN